MKGNKSYQKIANKKLKVMQHYIIVGAILLNIEVVDYKLDKVLITESKLFLANLL
ncbi:MAG: hypothetical protein ACRYFA_12620 [Janthinobacterium lividum]